MSFSTGNLKERNIQELSSLWLSDFPQGQQMGQCYPNQSIRRNLLFLEPIIWTTQEAQPTQPIVAWNLWYVFPVLGNRSMFSGASGSIVFPRLAIVVCFPAFCISGLCVFAALDIISFSHPRHRFELQLSYLRFLWIIRCDCLRWFSLIWTLPNFPGYRKNVRRRFKKTFCKWRGSQCW